MVDGTSTSSPIIDDWKSLFEFSRQFLEEKHMTATQLMIFLDIPVTMIQYLYNSKITPSKKRNTNGYKLRQKLKELQEISVLVIVTLPEVSFAEGMFDFEILHQEELNQFGIENFFCSEEHGKRVIKAITRRNIDILEIANKLNELGLNDLGFGGEYVISAQQFELASQ